MITKRLPSMVYVISLGLRMERFVGLRALGIPPGLGSLVLINRTVPVARRTEAA